MTTTTITPTRNFGWYYPIETGFGWIVEDRRTGRAHTNPVLGDLSREQAEALTYRLHAAETGR